MVQRTSSDLRLNPHVHAVFLDGGYRGDGEEFTALGHLRGSEVAEVLAKAKRRIERVLVRAAVRTDDESELPLLASVSGQPPAGPALRRVASLPAELPEGKLCVSEDGYNLHAATTAGAADARGREALLRYILRPPVAQERIAAGPSDLVRIVLKKPFSDGTVAIDLDPLSLLLRLCAAVPAPRFHTIRYCRVLASGSKLRPKIIPKPKEASDDGARRGARRADEQGLSVLAVGGSDGAHVSRRRHGVSDVRRTSEARRFRPVAALGGQIAIESAPRSGTTIRVVLPAAPGQEPAQRGRSEPVAPIAGARHRVLIVDDDPLVGAMLSRTLSRDHDVVVADCGARPESGPARGSTS